MTHVDETVLMALRDGEAVAAEARTHVETCLPCRHALAEVRARASAIEALIGAGTGGRPAVDDGSLAEAKVKVRARLDAQRAREGGMRLGISHLRRAAAILLLTAGAASALPGSPVRAWLGLNDEAPSPHDTAISAPVLVPETPSETVVLIPAGAGIEIELLDLPADSEVELAWLDGSTAQVSGGPGTRYAVADGQARATAPNGPVRLGIPRSAPRISIAVNGRMVYRGTSEEADVADVARRTANGLVFVVPRL